MRARGQPTIPGTAHLHHRALEHRVRVVAARRSQLDGYDRRQQPDVENIAEWHAVVASRRIARPPLGVELEEAHAVVEDGGATKVVGLAQKARERGQLVVEPHGAVVRIRVPLQQALACRQLLGERHYL